MYKWVKFTKIRIHKRLIRIENVIQLSAVLELIILLGKFVSGCCHKSRKERVKLDTHIYKTRMFKSIYVTMCVIWLADHHHIFMELGRNMMRLKRTANAIFLSDFYSISVSFKSKILLFAAACVQSQSTNVQIR